MESNYEDAPANRIVKMQRSQSKILRMITNAPWYVIYQTLHHDLKVPFINDVIQQKSINDYWNRNKEEG
jgi:hypothetical protein